MVSQDFLPMVRQDEKDKKDEHTDAHRWPENFHSTCPPDSAAGSRRAAQDGRHFTPIFR
jgi:hypothetical protein